MLAWLRLLLMVFYAPSRAMREVRDRAGLAPAGLVALLAHASFFLCLTVLYLGHLFGPLRMLEIVLALFQAASSLIFIALIFCPLALLIVNLFERRASFRLLLQQEYSPVASTMFYALTASSLIATMLAIAGSLGGIQLTLAHRLLGWLVTQRSRMPPDMLPQYEAQLRLITPNLLAAVVSFMILLALFGFFATLGLRIALRLSWVRSLIVVLVCGALIFPLSRVLMPIFIKILASPFLLFMLFLLLRGYFSEITRNQRARESFKQNLEAATLNPADASAHYNLGLIHQQRGELEAARERFERAVQIDGEEIDAHYQLGRIARQQKRPADAIKNFEQVVARDQSHAQYEIWREVGATYIAAGQFEDARMALERFLDRRESDPEGLYLMGRAHAGLGHRREAASLMEACINAVKSAPAYKYRLEKRWLNEAQQFLRSQV
jgi:tetratricopeptide (TPR) repeat protein